MSYSAVAESYSRAKRVPYVDVHALARGISFSEGWSRFDQVYSDIADCTNTDGCFRTRDLLEKGALPSIAALAPKTRRDIVQVVLRDMLTLPAEADGLERVFSGCYRWRFASLEAT